MDAGGFDKLGDLGVGAIVTAEILDQVKQQLSSHHLIAMHVTDVLKLWFTYKRSVTYFNTHYSAYSGTLS